MTDPSADAPPPPWTAPGAPPFGAPAPPPSPSPSPGASGYAMPPGYAAPAAIPAQQPPAQPPSTRSPSGTSLYGAPKPARRGLGVAALVIAVIAVVVASVVGAVAGYQAALGAAQGIASNPSALEFDWAVLSPVRDLVLVAELSFWFGTVVGVWALVQGIVAIVKDRGRGWGIGAVAVAAAGPVLFAVCVQIAVSAGLASGVSSAF